MPSGVKGLLRLAGAGQGLPGWRGAAGRRGCSCVRPAAGGAGIQPKARRRAKVTLLTRRGGRGARG
jgi:hypothetical protein